MSENTALAELPAESLLGETPETVVELARTTLEDPKLLDLIIDDVHSIGVAGEEDLIATIYLVATSRKLPRPCNAIVQSPTSTGKTIIVAKTTSCIPPEEKVDATTITPNALFYVKEGALKHKLVVSGERRRAQGDDQADATSALRQMLSDGRISKLVTDTHASPPTTRNLVIEGPIAYIETTTSIDIFPEDLNRCLILCADERPEQTRLVLRHIAAAHSGESTIDSEAVIQQHHAMQRMLLPTPIVVPFARQLADSFPNERTESRRGFGQLLGMIEACALLHQYQRERDANGRVVATPLDYEIAVRLCRSPLEMVLGGKISDAAIRFRARLGGWNWEQFTSTEAATADNKSRQAIGNWLSELASIGAVEQVTSGSGSRPAVWRLTDMTVEDVSRGRIELLSPEALQGDSAASEVAARWPDAGNDEEFLESDLKLPEDEDDWSPF